MEQLTQITRERMNGKPVFTDGYCVYVITNAINGKRYIGLTCNPKRRWQDHKDAHKKRSGRLYAAMRKYGFENFSFTVLYSDLTQQDANRIERALIVSLSTADHQGYNATIGGRGISGYRFPDETKQRISASLTARFAREGSWNTGRKHSAETRQRRSEARLGYQHSEETKRRMSASALKGSTARSARMVGTHLSEETKRKISKANKGKQMPREAVERIAALNRGRKLSVQARTNISLGHRRVTKADVEHARRRRSEGAVHRVIAEEVGVCTSQVSRILSGKAWAINPI